MYSEEQIKKIVEKAIPFDSECPVKKKSATARRIYLLGEIKKMLGPLQTQTYEPREQYK